MAFDYRPHQTKMTMKKLFIFPVLATLAIFTGCGDGSFEEPSGPVPTPTTGDKATINGTTWATRNLDTPETFADTPEDFGMLYQWNSTVAWSVTDPIFSEPEEAVWQDGFSASWDAENDPCPEGWRLPTLSDLQSLTNANLRWGLLNGVRGASFSDKTTGNSIFIPAAPRRESNQMITNPVSVGQFVQYSTSSRRVDPERIYNPYVFCFNAFGVTPDMEASSSHNAHPVRCVEE
jgi:uncharacterized protein (TIGR02145 family)